MSRGDATDFEAVVADFAGDRRVVCGRKFGTDRCLTVDGKIFAMQSRAGFVVKLPRARAEAVIASGAGRAFETSPGRVMREWVVAQVGPEDWIGWAREAYAFVGKASVASPGRKAKRSSGAAKSNSGAR